MIAGVAILFHGNAIVSIQSWQIIVIFAPILSCVGKTQMFLIMKGIVWEHVIFEQNFSSLTFIVLSFKWKAFYFRSSLKNFFKHWKFKMNFV